MRAHTDISGQTPTPMMPDALRRPLTRLCGHRRVAACRSCQVYTRTVLFRGGSEAPRPAHRRRRRPKMAIRPHNRHILVLFKTYMFQRFILITVAQKWPVAFQVGRRVRFSSSRAQAPDGMGPGSGRDDEVEHGRAMQHDQAYLGLAQQRSGRHFDGSQLVCDGARTPG